MEALKVRDLHPSKERTVHDLARYVSNRAQKQPNYCFLLGAGASVTSGVRSAGSLVDRWRKEIYCELNHDGKTYEAEDAEQWLSTTQSAWYDPKKEYASLFERKFDLPAQRRIFVEQEVENASPSIGYAYLTSLVRDRFINTLFTTNFDDLINEAFFRFTDIRPISCAHDSSVRGITVTSLRPKIVKLHGDYLFDDLKCTADQTSKLTENMEDKLKQFLKEYGLIVSGYSGCDDSVMGVLNNLVNDDSYLKNGIYWCLRKTDFVSQQLSTLLKSEKVFFVYTDDFDGLFADIHSSCCKDDAPFAETNLSSRVSQITDRWLNNIDLEAIENKRIKKHLIDLKSDKNSSLLARSLAGIFHDESSKQNILDKITDEEAVELIELQKLISKKKYLEAEEQIKLLLSQTDKTIYKERLLEISFKAHLNLSQNELAIHDCHELIKLNPDDPINYIREADATREINEKISLLDKAISKDEYTWVSHHEKATALIEGVECGALDQTDETTKDIKSSLNKSIECRPGINNPSWPSLFDFFIKHDKKSHDRDSRMRSIIDDLRKQDAHSPKTCRLIYNYCKENNNPQFNGTDIFSYLDNAITCYYPKHSPSFLSVIVDASLEFDDHQFATSHYKQFDDKDIKDKRAEFSKAKYKLFFDIYKDIDKAIDYLKLTIERYKTPSLLSNLIDLLILKSDPSTARDIADKYFYLLPTREMIELESDILTSEGKYQEAIDELEKLSDDPYFDRKHAISISFIYLKAGNYQRASDYCNRILSKYSFTDNFSALRINYEFARKKLGRKVHKPKIDELLQVSSSKDTKAMAALLMGHEDECLEIMIEQAKKHYSKIYRFGNWPVAESIIARFHQGMNFESKSIRIAHG